MSLGSKKSRHQQFEEDNEQAPLLVELGELQCGQNPVAVDPTVAGPSWVAVRGDRQTFILGASVAFPGQGILSCPFGEDSIRVFRAGEHAALELPHTFDSVPQALEVEGVRASDFVGAALEWKLLPRQGYAVGTPLGRLFSVLEAKLRVCGTGGDELPEGKQKDGSRVVHVRKNRFRRAKALVKWEPQGFTGNLTLSSADGRLAIHGDPNAGAVIANVAAAADQRSATVYLEGVAVSGAPADAEITLGIEHLGANVDAVKLTVVDTALQVCKPRVDDKTDPDPSPDGKRGLYRQGNPRASTRAKLIVTKTPADAPCVVRLKRDNPNVTLFDREVPLAQDVTWTDPVTKVQTQEKKENQVPPEDLANAAFSGPARAFVAWAEGTALGSTKFSLDVPDVDGDTAMVELQVGQAQLEVAVVRADGTDLSAPVKVGLKKEIKSAPVETKDCAKNANVAFDVDPGSYLLALTPQSQEKDFKIVRLLPDTIEASIVVPEKSKVEVKFQVEEPPRYQFVEFIGYQIKTGVCMGEDLLKDDLALARQDLAGRCTMMKEAVRAAHAASPNKADPQVLKIFMAPEFFFRGKQGAYPLETIVEIPDQLRAETKDAAYQDWLFVFGSALGFVPVSEASTHGAVKAVTRVNPPPGSFYAASSQPPNAGDEVLVWTQATNVQVYETVKSVALLAGNIYEIECNNPVAVGPGQSLWLVAGGNVSSLGTNSFVGLVRLNGAFAGVDIPEKSVVRQGTNTGYVFAAAVDTIAHTCSIYAEFPASVNGVDLTVEIPAQSEILNVALVQKGGPGTPLKSGGERELKELLVYKESISWFDFEGPHQLKDPFWELHISSLRSDPRHRVLPTQGSADLLGRNPNALNQPRVKAGPGGIAQPGVGVATEVNETGLGGGSIFSLDGFTFGLEVCRDHCLNRLEKTGTKVDIQLLPACGMSITNSALSLVPGGLIFGNDGDGPRVALQRETTVVAGPTVAPAFTQTKWATYFPHDGSILVFPKQAKP